MMTFPGAKNKMVFSGVLPIKPHPIDESLKKHLTSDTYGVIIS
jgi:hypothetical protein